jgi:hypothetical protein
VCRLDFNEYYQALESKQAYIKKRGGGGLDDLDRDDGDYDDEEDEDGDYDDEEDEDEEEEDQQFDGEQMLSSNQQYPQY